jgi:hypothetical protein
MWDPSEGRRLRQRIILQIDAPELARWHLVRTPIALEADSRRRDLSSGLSPTRTPQHTRSESTERITRNGRAYSLVRRMAWELQSHR